MDNHTVNQPGNNSENSTIGPTSTNTKGPTKILTRINRKIRNQDKFDANRRDL